jgi:hypothetical protein
VNAAFVCSLQIKYVLKSVQTTRLVAGKHCDHAPVVQVANMHAKALEEDPSIFDYDSHFDAMQEQKVRPAMQEKIERKSRYIEALKDKAVQREREQNVVYERRYECIGNTSQVMSVHICCGALFWTRSADNSRWLHCQPDTISQTAKKALAPTAMCSSVCSNQCWAPCVSHGTGQGWPHVLYKNPLQWDEWTV